MFVVLALFVFYILFFSIIIKKAHFFRLKNISTDFIILVFITKCFLGIISFELHEKTIKGGDMRAYYKDAEIIYKQLNSNIPINYFYMLLNIKRNDPKLKPIYDNLNHWDRSKPSLDVLNKRSIIRFNAISIPFSFNTPQINTVFISFLSTIGLLCLFKLFSSIFKYRDEWFFIGLFLLPSSLFWNSSILKESLTIFAMGVFLLSANRFSESKKTFLFIIFILSSVLFLYVKAFFFFVLFPFVLLHMYFNLFKHSAFIYFKKKNIIVYLFLLTVYLIVCFFYPTLSIFEHIKNKQLLFIDLNHKTTPRSGFEIPLISEFYHYVIYTPNALINSILQPQLLSFKSPFYIFPILENILLIGLLIIAFYNKASLKLRQKSIIISISLFLFICLIIIGFTVPIQGAITRYKAPLMPFVILLIIMIADPKKIKKKCRKLSISLK